MNAEIILACVTLLLLPVFFYSAKEGFNLLQRFYMLRWAKENATTQHLEDLERIKKLEESLKSKIQNAEKLEQDLEQLKRTVSGLETVVRLSRK